MGEGSQETNQANRETRLQVGEGRWLEWSKNLFAQGAITKTYDSGDNSADTVFSLGLVDTFCTTGEYCFEL